MVQSVDKRLFLREPDGEITPFDAMKLQTRLIGAFLSAGLREESCMSEEIVLALEYTLLTSPRPEPIFSRSEIDAAVIRTLEGCGFPEVAAVFRKSGTEQVIRIEISVDALNRLFASHLGCSPSRSGEIAAIVAEKFAALEISAASPHLLLEFARHYERDLASEDVISAMNMPEAPPEIALSREKIYSIIPPESRALTESGILRINTVTTFFPSVRFFFFMKKFASVNHLGNPVTELEALPLLYNAGNALEAARSAIVARLPDSGDVPCCINIPDLKEFMDEYAGAAPNTDLEKELTAALTGGLKCELLTLVSD